MKLYLRPLSRIERLMQEWRARLAAYDTKRLVDVCLLGVTFVWFVYVVIFKPVVMP
jgi:hypothetical protein